MALIYPWKALSTSNSVMIWVGFRVNDSTCDSSWDNKTVINRLIKFYWLILIFSGVFSDILDLMDDIKRTLDSPVRNSINSYDIQRLIWSQFSRFKSKSKCLGWPRTLSHSSTTTSSKQRYSPLYTEGWMEKLSSTVTNTYC